MSCCELLRCRACRGHRGYSLVETLAASAILSVLAGAAVPSLVAARDEARARSAGDHLAALLHATRMEALKRHAHVALRFEPAAAPEGCAMYEDGNGNGVRTSDIEAGDDRRIRPYTALDALFPGVRFGLEPGVPGIDGGESAGDGVRIGRSRLASFSPEGTSTSGTVYLAGRGHRQLAVRILGATGRVRVFEFAWPSGPWRAR